MASALFAALLNTTVRIQRKGRTDDGQGGWSESYDDGTDVAARVRPALGEEREAAARRQYELSRVVYLPYPTTIQRDDRLAHGETTYTVRAVRVPSEGHHLEVDVEEIQRGR